MSNTDSTGGNEPSAQPSTPQFPKYPEEARAAKRESRWGRASTATTGSIPVVPGPGQGPAANKCLSGSGSQGQQISTGPCNGDSIEWTFTSNGLLRAANGLCADVEGASQSPGARVIFFKCSGNSNQRYTLVN